MVIYRINSFLCQRKNFEQTINYNYDNALSTVGDFNWGSIIQASGEKLETSVHEPSLDNAGEDDKFYGFIRHSWLQQRSHVKPTGVTQFHFEFRCSSRDLS
jgi:hypothetical protein